MCILITSCGLSTRTRRESASKPCMLPSEADCVRPSASASCTGSSRASSLRTPSGTRRRKRADTSDESLKISIPLKTWLHAPLRLAVPLEAFSAAASASLEVLPAASACALAAAAFSLGVNC